MITEKEFHDKTWQRKGFLISVRNPVRENLHIRLQNPAFKKPACRYNFSNLNQKIPWNSDYVLKTKLRRKNLLFLFEVSVLLMYTDKNFAGTGQFQTPLSGSL